MKRALVVDDDRDIIHLIQIYLEEKFTVVASESAEDAFVCLEHMTFDLIIVDIYLPDMSGKEIIKKARSLGQTPILAISGFLQKKAFLQEFKILGANDFLEKPFMMVQFLKAIEELTPT
jgi:DNA-binding response OmpR family regulator